MNLPGAAGHVRPETVINLDGVSFSYGRRQVLDGLALSIDRGAIFGLLGANGAGKTTLIRLLVGLNRPRVGQVHVFGRFPSPSRGRHVGYMPQLNALYLELTARQNVEFFARMNGLASRRERREAVERALDVVALGDRGNDQVLKLSGGMRQRVSLACTLVHSPTLLLLDEPTVGLDPELRTSFWDHFRTLASQGTTIVISSHTMDDANHCDELAFLQDGRVVAQGSPVRLRAAAGLSDGTLEEAFLYYVRQGRS